jgi:hypothetical protein
MDSRCSLERVQSTHGSDQIPKNCRRSNPALSICEPSKQRRDIGAKA